VRKLSADLQELVKRLVDLHGETGLSPTAEDWVAILLCPPDKPLNILNLLKFKASTQEGEVTESGFAAYGAYSAGVGDAFTRIGGRTLYFGKVNHIFGTVAGTDWDAAILTRYPAPLALASFWLDEGFIAAHHHRENGVAASRVLVLSSLRGE
jgi:uncharacterized protein (DUF1330 family)